MEPIFNETIITLLRKHQANIKDVLVASASALATVAVENYEKRRSKAIKAYRSDLEQLKNREEAFIKDVYKRKQEFAHNKALFLKIKPIGSVVKEEIDSLQKKYADLQKTYDQKFATETAKLEKVRQQEREAIKALDEAEKKAEETKKTWQKVNAPEGINASETVEQDRVRLKKAEDAYATARRKAVETEYDLLIPAKTHTYKATKEYRFNLQELTESKLKKKKNSLHV